MDFGEWQAHFIDTSSILRKGKGSDSRGVRYATMELPANVGAPMVIEDLEMLRHSAEEAEPRLREGLLSIVEAIDLSLIQLSNEEGRRIRNMIESFRPTMRPDMRIEQGSREPIDQANYTPNKNYDGNKNYR
jgi:hypothetical protein